MTTPFPNSKPDSKYKMAHTSTNDTVGVSAVQEIDLQSIWDEREPNDSSMPIQDSNSPSAFTAESYNSAHAPGIDNAGSLASAQRNVESAEYNFANETTCPNSANTDEESESFHTAVTWQDPVQDPTSVAKGHVDPLVVLGELQKQLPVEEEFEFEEVDPVTLTSILTHSVGYATFDYSSVSPWYPRAIRTSRASFSLSLVYMLVFFWISKESDNPYRLTKFEYSAADSTESS